MELLGFLDAELILPHLKATSKDEVLKEMLSLLRDKGRISKAAYTPLLEALRAREALGSTGMGNGIAIPHVKQSPDIHAVHGVFARSIEGVDYDAVDGEPVHLFFLMLSPRTESREHLHILRKLAKVGRNTHLCRLLLEAEGTEEVAGLLAELGEE